MREGRLTPFAAVDHITPKAKGGTDADDNLEAICGPCHDAKSMQEANADQSLLRAEGKPAIGLDGWVTQPKQWGYSIPQGMRPAGCKTYIIAGPPASGKTTYVNDHATKGDKVIDLDEIKQRIGGKPWDDDTSIIAKALRYRDMAIRGLADRSGGTAWLIITGKTKAERQAWVNAIGHKAELIEVIETADECERRIRADPRRNATARQTITIAREWER